MNAQSRPDAASALATFILQARGKTSDPYVVGLCGPQGSGKSTIAAELAARFNAAGVACVTVSLDDLVLPKSARRRLAKDVHPLLVTRGPPGTHDMVLGLEVLSALKARRPVTIPRFDKLSDDRLPMTQWRKAPSNAEVILFEGWCVGAVPQASNQLRAPINTLERRYDPDGAWRGYVNARLAQDYQTLFGQIDALALLKAPSFDAVFTWRLQQERANQAEGERLGLTGAGMDCSQLRIFIQHYERVTRHILQEMPRRAGLTLELSMDRQLLKARSTHTP